MSKQVHFEPASHIRYLTVDAQGNTYPVTDLLDAHARETTDPALADWCLVHNGDDVREFSTIDIPVYTVH